MRDLTVIIPAYDPDETLVGIVRELADAFPRILVVDDGSDSGRNVFDAVRALGATVLVHPQNRGKGAALKTAFRHVLERLPEAAGAVTVDADGQHLAKDVRRVAAAAEPGILTLGARSFAGAVPFRSRLGNLWTRGEFRLLTGATVSDTQSGLRALPRELLEEALAVPGERYEYEIAALVAFAKRGCVKELPITTVYAPGNPTSHYRPLADTVRTQRALLTAAFPILRRLRRR